MDLDASIKSLREFKTRMEKLFDGGLLERLERAAEQVSGSPDEEVGQRIEEIGEHVTALEQRFDAIAPQLAEIRTRLQEAQPRLAAVEKLADPAVLDLLDWLARNREGLDVLLSIGETVDGTAEPDVTDKGAPVPLPGGPDAPHPSDAENAQASS